MDDAPAPADAPVADAGPDTAGDTESEAYQQPDEGGEEPPPRQYVEIDDPDNRYERVKVAGEELKFPTASWFGGTAERPTTPVRLRHWRSSARKRSSRLNLQRALDANPEMTLRILAEQRGITLSGSKASRHLSMTRSSTPIRWSGPSPKSDRLDCSWSSASARGN